MFNTFGYGSVQMSQNDILIFGGGSGQTYNFDTQICFKKPSALSLNT